ncbi:hypothetical protein ACHAW5_004121 [Stephanodiscus triporus]|uniref:Pre-mRNA-splicing factor SYF1 n=1 Tax=Stephanodiscus triporus TaxID=2934178 RepID=A0ABD3QGL8_9STRA
MTTEVAPPPPPPPPPPDDVPPPPPPPPLILPAIVSSCLSTVMSYPALSRHEEGLSTRGGGGGGGGGGAYDVAAWIAYLESIDDALEVMNEIITSRKKETTIASSSSSTTSGTGTTAATTTTTKKADDIRDEYDGKEKDGMGGGGWLGHRRNRNRRRRHLAHTTAFEAGGRTFRVSGIYAHGITHDDVSLIVERRRLEYARIVVGERAVSILPGSYKLWMDHLSFMAGTLDRVSSTSSEGGLEEDRDYRDRRVPPYLVRSSSSSSARRRHRRYRATVSAYERSLVRLHRMPMTWLRYAAFVATYDPYRDPTTVRRIYDRALTSLPAGQHDRVWEDYLFWVTGILPRNDDDGGRGGGGGGHQNDDNDDDHDDEKWKNVRRRGYHKVRYGFESPLVSSWRRRGWEHRRRTTTTKSSSWSTVPTETAMRILRRHATCFDTTYREDLATLCATRYGRYGEAASLLLQLLNNEQQQQQQRQQQHAGGGGGSFLSPYGTTRHELWMRFADVCTAHPNEARVAGVDFDGIVRAVLRGAGGGVGVGGVGGGGGDALGFEAFDDTAAEVDDENDDGGSKRAGGKRATSSSTTTIDHGLGEMEGTLWTRLAEYHVRAGDFELARSVYEEALDAISRVRDFSLVFDAYVKFEEGVIEALMELMEEEEEEEEEGEEDDEAKAAKGDEIRGNGSASAGDDEDLDILLGDGTMNASTNDEDVVGSSADVDLAISRAEHLTSRRPLLLNRVLLRQNPHNVGEWIKRSKLYLDLDEVDLAASALEESLKAVSSRKSVNGSPCTLVLTLADIHENRRKDVDSARKVLERICADGEYDFHDAEDLAQCHASWVELELRQENWDMALNLARRAVSGKVGNKGSKAARGLSRSLRLWNLLFDLEESLGTVQTTKDAYDRALELKVATPSHVLNYASFLKDKKYFEESFAAYERGLGLFPFPHAGATLLWKNYLTDFLERYGGSKTPRARELFDRCLDDCPSEESPEFYLLYGDYEETHGLTKRALGAAISALEDGPASRICLEYAKMETGLREVDRARTVLVYGSQLADPRRDPDYWKAWHEFEVSFGNEETFREMLRVKRSVQAAFSTVNYNAAEMGAGVPQMDTMTEDDALEMIAEREGVSVEKKPLVGGFVQGKKRTADMADLGEVERRAARLREAAAAAASGGGGGSGGGGDEIDIDDDEDDEGENKEEEQTVGRMPSRDREKCCRDNRRLEGSMRPRADDVVVARGPGRDGGWDEGGSL